MYKAVKAKFGQNDNLKQSLVEIGDCLLGEASRDPYWGIGSTLNNPQSTITHMWTGNNELGTILMKVRDELK